MNSSGDPDAKGKKPTPQGPADFLVDDETWVIIDLIVPPPGKLACVFVDLGGRPSDLPKERLWNEKG
jgi:hypothetical protein